MKNKAILVLFTYYLSMSFLFLWVHNLSLNKDRNMKWQACFFVWNTNTYLLPLHRKCLSQQETTTPYESFQQTDIVLMYTHYVFFLFSRPVSSTDLIQLNSIFLWNIFWGIVTKFCTWSDSCAVVVGAISVAIWRPGMALNYKDTFFGIELWQKIIIETGRRVRRAPTMD